MHQKEKWHKKLSLYSFTNYYSHMISIHSIGILPFPAMISLLVMVSFRKIHFSEIVTTKSGILINYLKGEVKIAFINCTHTKSMRKCECANVKKCF